MLDKDKRQRRRQARIIRQKLFESSGPAAAEALAEQFLASILIVPDMTVSGYWPMGNEIDVRPLCLRLRESGVVTALPVVIDRHRPLIFRAWDDTTELADGPYGTHQPTDASPVVVPDILLVPMLAFDNLGNRLGYGGGYYDRTLIDLRARKPVQAIGVAFAGQRVDRLEVGRHDAGLDGVVTESDVFYPVSL
ncbi:MAG: 5-formyltetrahydrofolate cyclo-ligase [Pseudomonadota bacterium]